MKTIIMINILIVQIKGNNEITELSQPENCENRNDPDLVQAFLKK
jgi:hypothetical protein